jgi:signal transduction histidine kinase
MCLHKLVFWNPFILCGLLTDLIVHDCTHCTPISYMRFRRFAIFQYTGWFYSCMYKYENYIVSCILITVFQLAIWTLRKRLFLRKIVPISTCSIIFCLVFISNHYTNHNQLLHILFCTSEMRRWRDSEICKTKLSNL